MSFRKLYWALLPGLWLQTFAAPGASPISEEKEPLQNARRGGIVVLKDLWTRQRDLPTVPVEISDAHGPQLLLSDKPEYLYAGDGITLQEAVKPGIVRLYIYHVPQPDAGPKTISAVIRNLGNK